VEGQITPLVAWIQEQIVCLFGVAPQRE